MKLISFRVISAYRNLKNIELKFHARTNTYAVIGNNGSGKSNVLEALSSVFKSLYTRDFEGFEFEFVFIYKLDGRKVRIVHTPSEMFGMYVDSRRITDHGEVSQFLPQRVVCNYSGEDMRIKRRYYLPVWQDYEKRLKGASGGEALRMIFVDKDLWAIILFVMICKREYVPAFDSFLRNELRINAVERIVLNIDDAALRTWNENATTFYLKKLSGYVGRDHTFDLQQFERDDDNDPFIVFNHFSNARSLIQNIDIVFNDGVDAAFLSEGEKKLMVVKFILEAMSNENSLVLLDEPDSHVHVAKKTKIVEMMDGVANRENIITSHSPSLVAALSEDRIIMLESGLDGLAHVVDKEKQLVVSRLTGGLWSLQKQNVFLASDKDIILVEGVYDDALLGAALKAMHNEGRYADQDYEYLPCGGASGVLHLMDKFKLKAGQRMFCFFDDDDAGWKAISCIFNTTYKFKDKNLINDFGRARKCRGIWIAPYPCVKTRAKGEYENGFNIEDYFLRTVFMRYIMRMRSINEVFDKDKLKRQMATDCRSSVLRGKDFKRFERVFSLIEEIKAADAQGQSQLP